jgi:hypothetical protein
VGNARWRCEDDGHVGQQRECQPLEIANVPFVPKEHLEYEAEQPEDHRIQVCRAAHEQAHRLPHGGNVCSDVHGVCDQQHAYDSVQDRSRENGFDVRRQAPSRDTADPRADHLDPHHQRISEDHCPEHVEAELRAGLGIGRDTAGIIIGRPGDEARAELLHPRMRCDISDQLYHLCSPRLHGGEPNEQCAGKPRAGTLSLCA